LLGDWASATIGNLDLDVQFHNCQMLTLRFKLKLHVMQPANQALSDEDMEDVSSKGKSRYPGKQEQMVINHVVSATHTVSRITIKQTSEPWLSTTIANRSGMYASVLTTYGCVDALAYSPHDRASPFAHSAATSRRSVMDRTSMCATVRPIGTGTADMRATNEQTRLFSQMRYTPTKV
jgi:hypothetical protein